MSRPPSCVWSVPNKSPGASNTSRGVSNTRLGVSNICLGVSNTRPGGLDTPQRRGTARWCGRWRSGGGWPGGLSRSPSCVWSVPKTPLGVSNTDLGVSNTRKCVSNTRPGGLDTPQRRATARQCGRWRSGGGWPGGLSRPPSRSHSSLGVSNTGLCVSSVYQTRVQVCPTHI